MYGCTDTQVCIHVYAYIQLIVSQDLQLSLVEIHLHYIGNSLKWRKCQSHPV